MFTQVKAFAPLECQGVLACVCVGEGVWGVPGVWECLGSSGCLRGFEGVFGSYGVFGGVRDFVGCTEVLGVGVLEGYVWRVLEIGGLEY